MGLPWYLVWRQMHWIRQTVLNLNIWAVYFDLLQQRRVTDKGCTYLRLTLPHPSIRFQPFQRIPAHTKPGLLCCDNIAISTSVQKISERLKLWMFSHVSVYPQQVQDASSGSVESMGSALADPLLTRKELITSQSSGANHLDLPLNDGDEYQDEVISDEDFWVSLVSSCTYPIFC